jgi:DNA-binding NarL/FixJ family response regulator
MPAMTTTVLEAAQEPPQGSSSATTCRQVVLLIEDSRDAMWLVLRALEKYAYGRYKLEWANCLSEGLSRLLNGGVDVVVLDLGLPDCSRLLSYAWVREAAPSTPVVVLTGDSGDETEFSVVASGANHYLVKERTSAAKIVHTINQVLGNEW